MLAHPGNRLDLAVIPGTALVVVVTGDRHA
jgi:hypothetical protein